MASRTALVLGVSGQDGAHLSKSLIDDGWTVYGGYRRGSANKTWRLDYLGTTSRIKLVECQINDLQNLIEVLREARPTQIYALAGESFVADSFKYWGVTLDVNTMGALNVLEAVRLVAPEAAVFFASSSEIFDHKAGKGLADESTPMVPANPYGISKLGAYHLVRLFRETYGLRVGSGVMFNHEGPLRGRQFVTRKITFNLARMRTSGGEAFQLGAQDAARDWGAAEDYVAVMRSMLAMEKPRDLVIATGKLTTVRSFLAMAATAAGFSPVFENSGSEEICRDGRSGAVIVSVSPKYVRPHDTPPLAGDASRLRALTGWGGSRSIEQLSTEMVAVDINRWKSGLINV